MTKKGIIPIHVTSFDFPEILLTTLGRDGKIPSSIKCISFGIGLYVVGIVSTILAGTFFPKEGLSHPFLGDTYPLVVSVVLGVTLAALIKVLSKVEVLIMQMRKICDPSKEKKLFRHFVKREKQTPKSFFLRPDLWYYLDTFGGAIIGGTFAYYWVTNLGSNETWWGTIDKGIAAYYFVGWCMIIAYVVGAAVYITLGTFQVLIHYCKNCIAKEDVLPASPDKVGGLRFLGHWSLQMDIVIAIPSFVIFDYLVIGGTINDPKVVGIIALYTIFLIIVFFIPLSAVHDAMLNAKEDAFKQINKLVKEIYTRIVSHSDISSPDLRDFRNLYFLYEKVEAMAVWPLDLSILSRFFATSLFPIVGSIIVSYIKLWVGQPY